VNKKKLRILLDTSFLLPFIGFKTDVEIQEAIACLTRHEIYYSDLSLLEAMWKIAKIVKKDEDIELIVEGVKLLEKTLKHQKIDENSIEIALEMRLKGHEDLVDNMLYSLALSNNMVFLTMDKNLEEFVKNHGMKNTILDVTRLKQEYCW